MVLVRNSKPILYRECVLVNRALIASTPPLAIFDFD